MPARALVLKSFDGWALLLLAVFLVQGLFLIQATSPTTDEIAFHMVNGYVYLTRHDFRMSPANPPLIREWMALPWLALRPAARFDRPSWAEADSVPFALEFFYGDNRGMADRLLWASRFMVLLLGAALGLVIYIWAKALYGGGGGLLSLSLYVFTPSLLGHASIAHTDIGVTFFCASSAYFLWRYLHSGTKKHLFLFAFCFALAAAAKYNALYLGPLFLFILGIKRGWRALFAALAMMLAVGFVVIWVVYFFEFKPLLAGAVPRVDEKLAYISGISQRLFPGNEGMNAFLVKGAQDVPIPLPSYLLGLAGILRSHQSPYLHYAFGEWTTRPHPFLYVFAFLVKMTLPFLALIALRALCFKKCASKTGHENLIVLLPVVVLFLITANDSTGVGSRYLFPVIPLLLVWVGGAVALIRKGAFWKYALLALVGWNAVACLAAFPNQLSYFNEAVGGTRGGYRHIRGSDVDWGQGLKALKKYMQRHGVENVALEYFGTADPSYYGISHDLVQDDERSAPRPKVYAISLYYLEHFKWAASARPAALVGGSIFIYDMRDAK